MSARDRLAALAWLTDRSYGKATQEVTGPEGGPTEGKFIVEYVDAQCPKCGYSQRDEVQGEQAMALGVHE